MKKIFAIFSIVAMMFAACTPDNGGENNEVVPTFPVLQEITVESGQSYEVTFTTDQAWTVSLSAEAAIYATLTYTYEDGYTSTDTQFYGEAGEHTIVVNVREDIVSYAKDITFNVDMTLGNYTQSIAKLTIPITPYEIDVYGSAPEGFDNILSKFIENGHPADGPFVKVPNKYSVLYLNSSDAIYGDYVVAHDFDKLFNYVVYAKDSEGNFVPTTDNTKWLELRAFTRTITDDKGVSKLYKMFSLGMNYKASDAVFTEGVGYEAYVNIEDENGDAVVSVYFIYDPNAEIVVETKMELANPELAEQNGIVFENNGYSCTMTYKTAESFTSGYLAGALKFTGYTEVYGGFGSGTQNLVFEHNEESDIWYVRLAEGASVESLTRTEVLNISAVSYDMHSYTINLVFDWIAAADGGEEIDYAVNFVNAEVANAAGATLSKLESTSADYDTEWGIDTQYCLTYNTAELFAAPAKAALNINGFEIGTVSNIHKEQNSDEFSYSDVLEFAKDASTGEVLLSLKEGADATLIPNGKCDLLCADNTGKKFIRILFVLNSTK
jgi:hypothetical protein